MKKTFYLFNPGVLERKDNTLKFTPCAEEGVMCLFRAIVGHRFR